MASLAECGLKAGVMRDLNASLMAVSRAPNPSVLEVKFAWVTTTRLWLGTTTILCPKLPLAE